MATKATTAANQATEETPPTPGEAPNVETGLIPPDAGEVVAAVASDSSGPAVGARKEAAAPVEMTNLRGKPPQPSDRSHVARFATWMVTPLG